ncbi:hypothetical protein [Halomonas chromatireducens]|uniref:Uncharacterized protein n=1 Tax=Halomonas chromatireducens TaxID=507626 RepID=A0A120JW89_9GAMM|nr:hypothetical protein [Halomonas chromatireducens]AMD01518.1 hypothetical protein LOKO_02458 [Halomonas chromatireducens]
MMSKEFLKKIGVFGVAIGLTASPFALAHAVDHEDAPGQEVEDVPSPDGPTDDTFADDPDTGAAIGDREDWEETDELERGTETEDVPGTEVPSEEAFPGDEPAPDAAPGADPAAPGTETAPGTDPATQGTETAPGTTPAAPGTETAPGAEDDAGFGEGTEPMPGTDADQDELEEDTY